MPRYYTFGKKRNSPQTEVDFQSSVNSFGPGSGATVFKAFSGAKPPIRHKILSD